MARPTPWPEPEVPSGLVVVAESGLGAYTQQLLDGRHHLAADEPPGAGGDDFGPGPYELLMMSLGACTSMTLRLYADRKGWALERVIVRLRHDRDYRQDCAECPNGVMRLDHLDREIEMIGDLDADQRARLMEIAEACPVHRTLTHQVHVTTRARNADSAAAPGAVASSGGNV